MKHPEREEWVPLLFGEIEPARREELEAHLRACPDCAAEIQAWRTSLTRLDAWKVPARATRATRASRWNYQPMAWAAAALLMLGVGLGLGYWASPGQSNSRALEARLADLEKRSAQTVEALVSTRAQQSEDLQMFAAAFRALQENHRDDFVSLRKDLETVAALTDEEIRAAREKLVQLTSVAVPHLEH